MNRLNREKSPYLLQHAGNPVDWYPWGSEAFEVAQREEKPIFLSVGYSTCHWCHVMAHESFESEQVAQILNRNFVPVKVDREERPDVDAVYMDACLAMNGSGGWPLTVLLTPEQKPFWAGTYLPKVQLLSLLKQASRLWRENRKGIEQTGAQLTEHLRRGEESAAGRPSRALVRSGVAAFEELFDEQWGGFGAAPKFPSAHNLLYLLSYAQVTGEQEPQKMAEATLEHMYRGGLFDHVGGGFSRYSTDREWLVPHFEKMLYDNALLALAYTEAFRMTGREYYGQVARRTLDCCLSELTDPQGGFYCAQDADSEGVEGRFYLFTRPELEELLGAEAEPFCRRFGVTEEGNWEKRQNIMNLIRTEDWEQTPKDVTPDVLQRVREYRKNRMQLHRDDKVLTAWNALMIVAMARAGRILKEPRYLQAGLRATAFIEENLKDEQGLLLSRWREGEAAHVGKLDDYAFYAWALLELYEVTFDVEWLEKACETAESLLEGFFDRENGGFWPYANDGEQLITRKKETYDGAMPSGNAVAGLVLSRLGRLTGEEKWREAAALQLDFLAGAAERYPAGHSFALLALLEELWSAGELVVTAKEIPEELEQFLREKSHPGLVVLLKTPESAQRLGELAPFTRGYPIPEQGAQYYLCRDGACRQPVNSVKNLAF